MCYLLQEYDGAYISNHCTCSNLLLLFSTKDIFKLMYIYK